MRKINFGAGPAALPLPVLEQAQRELLDYEGTGISILEHSHRARDYDRVHSEVLTLFTELMDLPKSHSPVMVQGGASLQFAMLPMNFIQTGRSADYAVTGHWARLAFEEARRVGAARAACDTMDADGKYTRIPRADEILVDPSASYLHLTTNNTIYGTQWPALPDSKGVPLVADMCSDILSRPVDAARFALIYAGAQKNLGPAGLALIAIDRDWLKTARTGLPDILSYSVHLEARSIYHTPPTFAVYLVGLQLRWVKENGGAAGMAKRNDAKSQLLYATLDRLNGFYSAPAEKASRSLMNAVFHTPSPELDDLFCAEAEREGIIGMKGHVCTGGMRVSLYNAISLGEVETLASFMEAFAKRRG
ncbi:MAG: 3-phosphoserine/phosphohydroxythreonine transaminase [Elusimicrobia bacterium CG11_big_fil_rev_8_21_14_0_20_64_6]|nr:MAG: 3-phosphoserine/phosphohydroxythreonine transaminase [Elusimicrobia bacterium CG11_big_fil_rev_8_21_14_0_20_64_6]